MKISHKEYLRDIKDMVTPKFKEAIKALRSEFAIYGIILGAYFMIRQFYNFAGITNLLESNAGVKKSNFLFVSIYIAVINSFLEELFSEDLHSYAQRNTWEEERPI